MLITIIFDSRVGFYSTVIIVLIAGALRGNDYTFSVMNLFAGALAVYTVRDIKKILHNQINSKISTIRSMCSDSYQDHYGVVKNVNSQIVRNKI